MICGLNKNEYLMRECGKGCQNTLAAVNIKTSIFNLQYLLHFCIDFYAANMGGSAVNRPF